MPLHELVASPVPLDHMLYADLQQHKRGGIKVYVNAMFPPVSYYYYLHIEKETEDA
jgi:hypothetical protein